MNEIIEEILEREGGYVNHPADKGGPTNFGITQKTLANYREHAVAVTDVQALTRKEAADIYEAMYVRPFIRFAAAPKLMALVVDSAVQHGVSRVQGWLKAIPSPDPDANYRMLLQRRIQFYGEIVSANHEQAVFIKGWLNRVAKFVR